MGSNFPVNEKLMREETDFDPKDMSLSANARHVRWEQLMAENKGKIDVARGRALPGRPLRYVRQERRSRRAHSLRPHRSFAARLAALAAAVRHRGRGAEQGGRRHHGRAHVIHRRRRPRLRHELQGAEHLHEHPEFNWEKGLLRDMDAYPWTTFSVAK